MPGRRWTRAFRTPMGIVSLVLMGLVLGVALLGPILFDAWATKVDTANMLTGPTPEHWAGTDNLGRDLVARVIVATRLSIALALAATAVAVGVGLLLGAGPMLLGRRVGRLVTGGVDIAVAFPGILLALFFAVIFGVGAVGAVLAIGLAGAPSFGRLCHTLIASIGERDFVTAARIAGVSRGRVLVRHVLPNIGEPLVVNATIGAGGALLAFAGLSFLGLGVQQPAYDWGRLLQDGLQQIYVQPVGALAPGFAIVIAGLAFNLFGETIAKGFGISTTDGGMRRVTGVAGAAAASIPDPAADEAASSVDVGPEPVLDVVGLTVGFPAGEGLVRPVRGVTFRIVPGEAVGVVGESGSGKSLTALAIARLIEEPGVVTATRLRFRGADLLAGDGGDALRHLLGTSLSMVFQDPGTSFNPTRRVGGQLAEVGRYHLGMSRREARARAVDRLRAVRIPAPERRAGQYPHEFSGGMRQRAMIGMGLMGDPALIIADEPTTALDVTIQQQVLQLLGAIRATGGVALLLISHDVAVVREVCDRVLVMYAGRIVEDLPAAELGSGARHPYTLALVAAVPDMTSDLARPLAVIPGRPVDPWEVPAGCAYAARCPLADARCRAEDPPLVADGEGRRVACWKAGEPLPVVGAAAVPDEAPGEAEVAA
ncbi:MAG: dipeptide/oligopeptide/nickel ABC transporter permease/ATP-binding protein [Chloroflexota bacterium]